MKKLLFSVIAFALITISCNKYKDDFANLNARIDALAAQVQGVAALQTGITAIQAQLTALASAVAAIPNNTAAIAALQTSLNTLTTNVGAIQTALTTVAANVLAGTASTAALIAQLQTQITTNQTATIALINSVNTALGTAITNAVSNINSTTAAAITAAQGVLTAAITAAQNNINAATALAVTNAQAALTLLINNAFTNTNGLIGNLATQLTNAVATLNASIAAAVTAINLDNTNQTAALTALIAALQTALNTANANIALLIAASPNLYEGDLIINDEATLVIAEALMSTVNFIKGNVTINTTALSAGQKTRLDVVTAKMFSVIGVGNTWSYTGGSGTAGFPNLVSITGDVVINANALLNMSGLITVTGNYSVSGNDVNDGALATVNGGDVNLDYAGAYESTSLTTINGNLNIVDNGYYSPVNFPSLATVGTINGNTPSFSWASSVNFLSGNLVSLNAPSADVITLGETSYPGAFTLWAGSASTISMSAVTVGGVLTIAGGWWGSTVNLNSLASTLGGLSVTTWGGGANPSTVNLANYGDTDPISIEGPLTQDIPNTTVSQLTSATIQTLTMARYRATQVAQFTLLTDLRNLTVGDVRETITQASFVNVSTLRYLTATVGASSPYAKQINLTGMTNLRGVTVTVAAGGEMNQLSLVNNDNLENVTTAGKLDFFIVDGCDDGLLTITMGHTPATSASGMGSKTIITNNTWLSVLNTSTTRMKELTVTGNPSLTSVNFASFVAGQNITAGVVTIAVHSNAIAGTYTPSVFAVNTPPIMSQGGLASLRDYAVNILLSVPHAGSTVSLGARWNAGFGTDNTASTLDLDRAAFILAGGSDLTTLVQRGTDYPANTFVALTSRIDNVRELGYITP